METPYKSFRFSIVNLFYTVVVKLSIIFSESNQ